MRFVTIIAVFLFVTGAYGQTVVSADGAGSKVDDLANILETLSEIPLPGEVELPSEPLRKDRWSGLLGKTVTRVSVASRVPGFDPVSDADIPLGIVLEPELVRRATARLWETGSYRDVQISARSLSSGGVELIVEVQPMFRISKLVVEGNDALEEDEVARALAYSADRTILPEPEALRTLRADLLKLYGKRGYRQAKAALSIETTSKPGKVALIVDIQEGEPEIYSSILIPDLPEELRSSGILWRVGLRPGRVRDRERVERSVDRLVAELAKDGYYDAKSEPLLERRTGPHSVELSVPLNVGIPTRFEFVGQRYLRKRDLRNVFVGDSKLRTSLESMTQALRRLKTFARENGFLHVRAGMERWCRGVSGKPVKVTNFGLCSAKTTEQLIRVWIQEGPTVEVGQVEFVGNKHFTDKQLKGELYAFIREALEPKELVKPLATRVPDDLGLSDKRFDGMPGNRGAKAPWASYSRTYVPELYVEAVDHLTELYREQGFLESKVADECFVSDLKPIVHKGRRFVPYRLYRRKGAASSRNRSGLSPCLYISDTLDQLYVKMAVEEGPQTVLDEIIFKKNEVFTSKQLLEVADKKIGDPFNEYELRQAAKRIEKLYKGEGYMFVVVTWEKQFSPDMGRARIVFEFDEGPQVRVGRIHIEGTVSTRRALVEERLVLEEGDVITPDKLEESQQRLTDLGILDSASVQMVGPEERGETKNIRVDVLEGKPQYLELRGGLATVEGVRGGFEYGYRNVGGWAINARLRVRGNYRLLFVGNRDFERRYRDLKLLGQLERHLLAGVGQKFLPGTNGLLGWGVDLIGERVNEPAFSATRTTGFFRLNTTIAAGEFRRAFVAEARTGLEVSDLQIPDEITGLKDNPLFTRYSRIPEGSSNFWVTGLVATVDLRDHPFFPSRGLLATFSADYVRSLSTTSQEWDVYEKSNLIRTSLTLSGYIPLVGDDLVLAVSATGGYIFHLKKDSKTWADRYFYVGGVDTLRGFPEESLLPEDIYQAWKETLRGYSDEAEDLLLSRGGEAMFVLRSEMRYPLAKGFYGAGFTELGNVWRSRKKFAPFQFDPFRVNLRPVSGVGVRYLTPLGPLSFDLGFNLNRRPHEDPLYWYLSIGSAF